MCWNDESERQVRPAIAISWGAILILLGVAGLSSYFLDPGQREPLTISMSQAHAHLDEWVAATDVRFDCEQIFEFRQSDRRYDSTYVVMISSDGSVVALAHYPGVVGCRPSPAHPVSGTFTPLMGTGPLGHMRQQGLRFPETQKALLAFEVRTEKDTTEWPALLLSAIFLVTGIQAVRSGVLRMRPNRLGVRTLR